MSNVVPLHEHHVIIGDDFWVDAVTGDWAADCQTGRNRAELLASHIANRDDIYPYYLRSMGTLIGRGRFTGVEVGFFQRLMELACEGVRQSGDTDARTQGL